MLRLRDDLERKREKEREKKREQGSQLDGHPRSGSTQGRVTSSSSSSSKASFSSSENRKFYCGLKEVLIKLSENAKDAFQLG